MNTRVSSSCPPLAVIVPVDLARRPRHLLARLDTLAAHPGMEAIEIVVAHNDRGTRHDRALRRRMAAFAHVTLASAPHYDGPVNCARLRNQAVAAAAAPVLMLLDADIHPDPALFLACAGLVAGGAIPLAMLPCLYLSQWASRRLQAGRMSAQEIVAAYLAFSRRHFQHMASPSSIVALRREDYWRAGGFDEAFTGHGYEDFDFLLRLAHLHRLLPGGEELAEDRACRAPLLAEGFRKQLGMLSLPWLLERRMAFHLYHRKAPADPYYAARAGNAKRLLGKLRAGGLCERRAPSGAASLIDTFFGLCRHKGVPARDFFVLFDTRPGHVDRLARWPERLRFLLGRR